MEPDEAHTTRERALIAYIRALSDPTRGAILIELEHAEELTATHLARRLNLTPNNIYHHMRILLDWGIVAPPRAEPGPTYVEKYYRLQPELKAIVHGDPTWVDRTQVQMSPQERKKLFIGMCLTMSQMLQRAARQYEAMDAAAFDELSFQRGLGMVSLNELSRPRYKRRLAALRRILADEQNDESADDGMHGDKNQRAERAESPEADPRSEDEQFDEQLQEQASPMSDLVLMAALPQVWQDAADDTTTSHRRVQS